MVDVEGRVTRGSEEIRSGVAATCTLARITLGGVSDSSPDGVMNTAVRPDFDGVRDAFREQPVVGNVLLCEQAWQMVSHIFTCLPASGGGA